MVNDVVNLLVEYGEIDGDAEVNVKCIICLCYINVCCLYNHRQAIVDFVVKLENLKSITKMVGRQV